MRTGRLNPHPQPPFSQQLREQIFDLRHIHGLILFDGPGLSRFYRLGLQLVPLCALLLAVWYVNRRWSRSDSTEQFPNAAAMPTRYMATVWLLFSLVLTLCLIVVPNSLGGGYFFATRLQIMLYLSLVVAAAFALQTLPRIAIPLAFFSFLLSLYTVFLGVRYITPVARQIATLREAPAVVTDGRPVLAMRTPGLLYPNHLTIYSFYWVPVDYIRWHNLLLYNTAWLGDPIIPIRPRPEKLRSLDNTFYNESPQFGSRLLPDEVAARAILDRVSMVIFAREAAPVPQSPFAEILGETDPGSYAAGWSCLHGTENAWYLCRPGAR